MSKGNSLDRQYENVRAERRIKKIFENLLRQKKKKRNPDRMLKIVYEVRTCTVETNGLDVETDIAICKSIKSTKNLRLAWIVK